MKFIVITLPEFFPEEPSLLNTLLTEGVDSIHVRKPQSSACDCARLLDALVADCRARGFDPTAHLRRLVLHDHHALCTAYGLQGVHLNGRNPVAPPAVLQSDAYTLSASCHSLAEVAARREGLDYLFLSPIFDSISKTGYHAAFTADAIKNAADEGLIDGRVVALGGISLAALPQLRTWHFGGAAFLGDVWRCREKPAAWLSHVRALRQALVAGC